MRKYEVTAFERRFVLKEKIDAPSKEEALRLMREKNEGIIKHMEGEITYEVHGCAEDSEWVINRAAILTGEKAEKLQELYKKFSDIENDYATDSYVADAFAAYVKDRKREENNPFDAASIASAVMETMIEDCEDDPSMDDVDFYVRRDVYESVRRQDPAWAARITEEVRAILIDKLEI